MRPLWIALSLLACVSAPALAESCPGNPDAIGTSRTITVDPAALPLIGTMQYKNTLPLDDHEVVITFDDGPIPPYSTHVLDTLKENCVKATYFLVGEMAREHPWLVRRIYNEGHTIGTHSETHPLALDRKAMPRIEHEIDAGFEFGARRRRRRPRGGALLPHPRPRAQQADGRIPGREVDRRVERRRGGRRLAPRHLVRRDRAARHPPHRGARAPRRAAAARHPSRHRAGAAEAAQASSRSSATISCRWCRPARGRRRCRNWRRRSPEHDAWPRIVKASVTEKRHHARHLLRHRHRAAHRRHQAANAEKAANLGYRGLWTLAGH